MTDEFNPMKGLAHFLDMTRDQAVDNDADGLYDAIKTDTNDDGVMAIEYKSVVDLRLPPDALAEANDHAQLSRFLFERLMVDIAELSGIMAHKIIDTKKAA